MDSRQGLKKGDKLSLYRGRNREERKTFVIKKEIGRGGSCIVYNAIYEDSEGMDHFVMLKECCPYQLNLVRDGDNALHMDSEDERDFKREKERFRESYKLHAEIQTFTGLVNATANITELYSGNNTLYSSMDYGEGSIYSEVEEETLEECLQRVKTTARVLEKYHCAGYLHLDIKPDNIWIFPETTEQIRLFDFNSIVKKDDLKEARGTGFFYTKGFAAPELEMGHADQISEATDVYGIGALLFFRLMGRHPQRQEREFFAVFDLSWLEKKNPLCQPAFFKGLKEFFSKTLKAASLMRFASMKDAADFLEGLIPLADPDAVYPIPNFSYHQANFIGRQSEKEQIRSKLSQMHVLFLHGIGGIGKTELALAYAYENQKEYNYILFLRYEGGLMESLCSDDMKLHNFSRESEERDEDYYKRKIDALKLALSGCNLLILDNFDTEDEQEWERLEKVLEIPCHILITSRYNPEDYNYPCLEVEEFKEQQELMELFRAYNDKHYSEEEQKAVEELIELEDRHTMTVELMAKNLRVSKMSPSKLLERLKQRRGIANMEDDPIGHRKDKKLRNRSVQAHLEVLFDLSGLEDEECYILDNLSLFAGIQVQAERFLAWCPDCSEENLKNLIQRGWIENRGEGNKISLHQVILDLIYHIRKPDGEKCKTLTIAMTAYLGEKISDRTYRNIRNRVLDIFGERIWPDMQDKKDFPYTAAFYLKYCGKSYKEEWADFCLREYEKYPEQYQNEIAQIYGMRAFIKFENIDDWDHFEEAEWQSRVLKEVVEDFHFAIWHKQKASMEQKELLGDFIFQIGEKCRDKTEGVFAVVDEVLEMVFDFIAECMERGVKEYSEGKYEKKRLLSMYEELLKLYDPDEFTIKPEKYCDLEKKAYFHECKKEIESAIEADEQRKGWIHGGIDMIMFYEDLGSSAVMQEDYENAVRYYHIALEKEESGAGYIGREIAAAYEKMGKLEEALEYYETYEDERNVSDFDIGRLYRKMGQYEKAAECFEKGLALCEQKIAKGSNGWKEDKLRGYMEASQLPGQRGQTAREQGMDYYRKEDYFREADDLGLSLIYVRWMLLEEDYEGLYRLLPKLYDQNSGMIAKDTVWELKGMLQQLLEHTAQPFARSHILFLLARLEEELYPTDLQAEEKYCLESIKLLEKEGQGDSVLAMKIRDRLGYIYRDADQGEKAKQYTDACDYEMLAMEKEKRILEVKQEPEEKEKKCIEVWMDAGDEYDYMDNLQRAIRCYKRAKERWEKLDREKKRDCLHEYGKIMSKWISYEKKNQNGGAGMEILNQWYGEVLDLCQDCQGESRGFSAALRDIEWYLEDFGKKSQAVLCRFQRGLLEIGIPVQEMRKLETVQQLAKCFFDKVSDGAAAQQIDAVLDVCDDVLKIGFGEGEGEEAEGIETACHKIISALRDGEISFKRP